MRSRHPSVWVVGLIGFVMNPAFACSSSDVEEFEYGEAEMIAAVQGTWRLTYTRPEGTSIVTFTVAPGSASNGALASPPGRTPQCGNRTFVRPAAACESMSQLRLAATVVEAEPPLNTANGAGSFTVYGLKYTGGKLELKFGADLQASADLEANNTIRQSYADWQGARVPSLLDRVAVK